MAVFICAECHQPFCLSCEGGGEVQGDSYCLDCLTKVVAATPNTDYVLHPKYLPKPLSLRLSAPDKVE